MAVLLFLSLVLTKILIVREGDLSSFNQRLKAHFKAPTKRREHGSNQFPLHSFFQARRFSEPQGSGFPFIYLDENFQYKD